MHKNSFDNNKKLLFILNMHIFSNSLDPWHTKIQKLIWRNTCPYICWILPNCTYKILFKKPPNYIQIFSCKKKKKKRKWLIAHCNTCIFQSNSDSIYNNEDTFLFKRFEIHKCGVTFTIFFKSEWKIFIYRYMQTWKHKPLGIFFTCERGLTVSAMKQRQWHKCLGC